MPAVVESAVVVGAVQAPRGAGVVDRPAGFVLELPGRVEAQDAAVGAALLVIARGEVDVAAVEGAALAGDRAAGVAGGPARRVAEAAGRVEAQHTPVHLLAVGARHVVDEAAVEDGAVVAPGGQALGGAGVVPLPGGGVLEGPAGVVAQGLAVAPLVVALGSEVDVAAVEDGAEEAPGEEAVCRSGVAGGEAGHLRGEGPLGGDHLHGLGPHLLDGEPALDEEVVPRGPGVGLPAGEERVLGEPAGGGRVLAEVQEEAGIAAPFQSSRLDPAFDPPGGPVGRQAVGHLALGVPCAHPRSRGRPRGLGQDEIDADREALEIAVDALAGDAQFQGQDRCSRTGPCCRRA